MYTDTEDASDIDEDFFNALALLHSTEVDSTEKLRKMLDATIEKKYGVDKTLTTRMPKKFLQNAKTHGKSFSNERSERQSNIVSRKNGNTAKKVMNLSTVLANDTKENNWNLVKTFDTEVIDYSEKEDVPTISIPDEGSGDGLLCKVCNGAKLGPLILLECQDCQEVYHPLCHQPPVVDIDVYDPRIVWRCSQCIDVSLINCATDFDEKKSNKFRHKNDGSKLKEASAKRDALEESQADLSKNDINIDDQHFADKQNALPVKDFSYFNQKIARTPSSNQLRKRIGSKLSVTRSTAK